MPRLNGKFVKQEVYDAAMAAQEVAVSEEFETAEESAEVFEEATADRKRGPRPTTVYKRAVNDRTAAEVKLIKARKRLEKFDTGRDELIAAVEAAEVAFVEAEEAVEAAAESL
jgi:hypothetical protein